MPTTFRRALLFTFALCLTGSLAGWVLAQDDAIEARMRKDITFLASDECEGRGVGTKGLELAAEYIAKQFKDAGLKPGGVDGTYFQPFPFSGSAELDGTSTLVLHGPKGEKIKLKQGPDFRVIGFSAAGKLTAPLVFAGYGVKARTIDYDDYKGIDVEGKVVVTLRKLPRWNSKDFKFDGANKDELSALEYKQLTGHANKAAAVILVNDETEMPNDRLLPFATAAKSNTTISIPYVQLKRSAIEDILRSTTGMGLAETEKAIGGDLKPRSAPLTGWTVELDVKINRQKVVVKNILGVVEGKGPLANETIVIGAHYDHVGYGEFGSLGGPDKQGDIHHGADDNGSGTTSIIELARRFGAMKDREGRRLVFMTFTAEERGLIGSRFYTTTPLFPLKDTVAMVNLDMVGRVKETKDGSPAKLLVLGTESSKDFDALVNKHNPGFNLVKDTNPAAWFGSDHYSFYQQKIPVIFFWTGDHPDYHRPTDTADKINVAGMKKVADLTERVVASLAADEKRPDYLPVKSTFKMGGPNRGGDAPKLGIRPDYNFPGKGVLVEDVPDGGPAQLAGLKAGDIIIELAGKATPNVTAYMALMRQQKANVAIEIKLIRDKKEMSLKVTPK